MIILICALLHAFVTITIAKDHPTLPTQWVAETIEPGAPGSGKGIESYNFVANPNSDQPSSMWSNYTGCQRLIHVTSSNGGYRYLLGCDSLDCCKESQEGNQVEFQIPNFNYANPTKVIEVKYTPLVNITNFGETVTADEWSWTFDSPSGQVIGEYRVYTNDCSDCVNGVELIQWQDRAFGGEWFPIQFHNYKGIDPESDEGQQFAQTFDVPEVCLGNIMTCP